MSALSTTDPGGPAPPLRLFDGFTTDEYQYLDCPGSSVVNLQVSNAQVYIGYGLRASPGGASEYPPVDESFLPVVASINQLCDQIRFKSYTPGTPAALKLRAK